jgi:hypothetical protein
VLAGGGKLNGEIEDRVTVSTGSNGIASCRWFLRGGNPPSPQTQQVRAALLDEHGEEMQTPVVFDANLSVAAEVAYDGQGCGTLQDQKTVQSAITRLSRLTRIVPLGGTGIDIGPDRPASGQLPVEVLVVNDCGPVEGARVRFTASGGGATEPPIVETSAGRAATTWTLGRAEPTQQVTATLEDPGPGNVLHLPAEVSFVANLSLASDTAYTPACAVLSDARTVQEAIDALAVLPRLLHVSGDGAHAAPGQLVDLEVGVAGDCGPDDRDRVVQFVVRQGDGVLEGPDPTGLVPTSGGRAGCGFRMGTDQRHLIEARLIREGTEAYQPPVFFTITRVTAVQVSYSPQCELLRRADVDNVQDAITALCRRLDPEQASMDLVLQRVSLENVDDAAGGWQFEGGRVLDDGGNQLGHFTSHKRIVANSGARVNAAMLTMTIFIDGPTPPENLTVQGAHSFDNGGENGSVSAASARFAQLIGRPFARSGDRVTIGGAGP